MEADGVEKVVERILVKEEAVKNNERAKADDAVIKKEGNGDGEDEQDI